jgi:CheY-like chemotaxis protein
MASKSTARLLVVDDVAANRNLLARLLERRGSVVETANDGTMAIEMIEDPSRGLFAFDAILMDGAMAPMGGRECSRRLRAMGVQCPIYAVSGDSEEDDVQTFLDAGATRLMAKPVRMDLLVTWLTEDTGFNFEGSAPASAKKASQPARRPAPSPAKSSSSSSSAAAFALPRNAPSSIESMPPPSSPALSSSPPASSAARKRKVAATPSATSPSTPEDRSTRQTTRNSSRLKRKQPVREDTPRPKKKYT